MPATVKYKKATTFSYLWSITCTRQTAVEAEFKSSSPEDAEVRQHQEIGEVAARIPDEEVLQFVNEGGINPFARRDWRSEPPDSNFDAASDVSDVSDFSVWRESCKDDSSDVDEDPDGPEFNSDYDTDPDVDSEGLSDDSDVDE